MQCIGYTYSEYEGKEYLKLITLNPVQEGRGSGQDAVKLDANPAIMPKLKNMSFPVQIRIADQQLVRKTDKNNRDVTSIIVLDIEVEARRSAQPVAA